MDDLIAFLKARLDERERLGRLMAEAVWPTEIGVVPRTDTGTRPEGTPAGCVGVAELAPKRWSRVWDEGQTDHGWTLHESAAVVWSPTLAKEILADVEAKRRVLEIHGSGSDPCDAHDASMRTIPCDTLFLLALPYSDHRDYRDEWKP